MTEQWQVRAVRPEDRPRWRELFQGYADFYQIEQTQEMADLVWSWIRDPTSPVDGWSTSGSSRRCTWPPTPT